jgi:hypothetical protein
MMPASSQLRSRTLAMLTSRLPRAPYQLVGRLLLLLLLGVLVAAWPV